MTEATCWPEVTERAFFLGQPPTHQGVELIEHPAELCSVGLGTARDVAEYRDYRLDPRRKGNMPKLLRSSETVGCGATIELDSKEVVYVSIAQTGVLVRLWNMHGGLIRSLLSNFFGPTLYNETVVYKNAQTAQVLRLIFPEQIPLLDFKTPVLAAFANAIWHCSSAAEVSVILNEAATKAAQFDNAAETAALQKAFDAAQNWPPKRPLELTPATYQVIYSDGVEQENQLTPDEINRWAVASNKDAEGKFLYRILRILDANGNIVWGK